MHTSINREKEVTYKDYIIFALAESYETLALQTFGTIWYLATVGKKL